MGFLTKTKTKTKKTINITEIKTNQKIMMSDVWRCCKCREDMYRGENSCTYCGHNRCGSCQRKEV